jgi:hypothetical protein
MAGLLAMPLGAWLRGERPLRPNDHVVAMVAMVGLALALTIADAVMGWLDGYAVAMWAVLAATIAAMIYAMRARWKKRVLACAATGAMAIVLLGGLPTLWNAYDMMSLKPFAAVIAAKTRSGHRPAICCWGPARHSLSVYTDTPVMVRFVPRWGGMDLMARFMLLHDGYCLWQHDEDLARLEAVAKTYQARVVTMGQTREFKLVRLEQGVVLRSASQGATAPATGSKPTGGEGK